MTSALTTYDRMRAELAQALSLDDVKAINDKAEALRVLARRAHDPEAERWMAEVRLRAQRQLGELSREIETAQGVRTDLAAKLLPGGGKKSTKAQVLKAVGISTSVASRCATLARIPEPIFEKYLAECREKRERPDYGWAVGRFASDHRLDLRSEAVRRRDEKKRDRWKAEAATWAASEPQRKAQQAEYWRQVMDELRQRDEQARAALPALLDQIAKQLGCGADFRPGTLHAAAAGLEQVARLLGGEVEERRSQDSDEIVEEAA